MFHVTNHVDVDAHRDEAWELISDFEGVWEPSNPAHRGTKVLDEPKQPIRDGLRWWQREKVGPVTGEFVATVHDVEPGRAFSWTTTATYKLLGIPLKVDEGGTFRILDHDDGVRLEHALWGRFPTSRWGRMAAWIARYVLREEKAMADHNRTELRYFKQQLEAA